MFRWVAPYPGLVSGVGSNLASEQGCKAAWNDGSGSTLGQASEIVTDISHYSLRLLSPANIIKGHFIRLLPTEPLVDYTVDFDSTN